MQSEDDKEFEPQYPAEKDKSSPTPTAILSPLYDSTFKTMLTQETEESNLALQTFISDVLGRPVSKVILKPNEPPKETTEQQSMTYDISVEFDGGELSDIEMQAWKEDYDYDARAEIQAARLLTNNAKKNDNWHSKKVYQISILNFHLRKDDKQEVSWYTLKDDSGNRISDRQNIIFIDLRTIRKRFGIPIEELTPIEKWGLFFSFVDSEEKADYISKLVRSEKGIMAADTTVRYMSEADANWFTQNSRYTFEHDRNSLIHNAEKRGLEAGRQQGIQEGSQQKAIEAAKAFLQENIAPETIAKCVKLPLETVLELQKEVLAQA